MPLHGARLPPRRCAITLLDRAEKGGYISYPFAGGRFRILHQPSDKICLSEMSVASIPLPASPLWPPSIFHVVPIRGFACDIFLRVDSIVIVTTAEPRAMPGLAVLCGLFDLTPAEARVARCLGDGKTLKEIADTFSVSFNTVRTQIRAILFKTGLRRQSELVGLLAGIAALNPNP